MEKYKKFNNIIGWLIFAIATIVYFLTVEPTASWWDCGEYIATAYKLQVGHPPGAPFFQLLGRFFTLFAFGDVSNVALMINIMSVLCSSFTILFLFWSITMLAEKVALRDGEMTDGKMYAIFASGIVGALAYTFSESFWFSAVEGEVYAMSSFFTAIVFWAILRWEKIADQRHGYRWLILIAYLMGLSIGVHLLNLLAIPAIAYVYYFKKYEATRKGFIYTGIISIFILAAIMYGIIPGIVKLSGLFELLFVNNMGLPFNSGTIVYFLLLIGLIIWGLQYTIKKRKVVANSIIIALVFILIGYSSFFMLVIRSNANTPIDENSPEDAISLLSYLNREQYGTWPIVHGQYFNAPAVDYDDGSPVYIKDNKSGKYIITDDRKNTIPVYDPEFTTLFPRMWSDQKPTHIRTYKQYIKKGEKVRVTKPDGSTEILTKPTFGENLSYFFNYQIGHMYLRYFMWNFAGRQNNIESQGEIEHGNWISGINFIDEMRLGNQDELPKSMDNDANNKFYLLPFILGLIGLLFHFNVSKKDGFVVFLLFFMTGIAIVIFLNQYPYQPRERDYAYAGSFYAFAIWIGMGVMALFNLLTKKINNPKLVAVVVGLVSLILVPGIMAKEGWDDHDRSGKYSARDFAANYLNSCAPNAVLFTNGDNDTFPLWYVQEVEGIRTDVRVVNYMLAGGDWYIHQLGTKIYDSEKLKFKLTPDQYNKGVNQYIPFFDRSVKGRTELKDLINFIASENEQTKVGLQGGGKINYLPTKRLKLTIDSAAVVDNGIVPADRAGEIVPVIEWDIRQNALYKNDLMFLDFLASNNWERPIYFANPNSMSKVFGVDEYCHLDGIVYKFMPIKAKDHISGLGGVDVDGTYDLLINKARWGNLNKKGVSIDRESMRNSAIAKQDYIRLATSLMLENKKDSAIAVLDKCLEFFPENKFTFNYYMIPFANVYYQAGAIEKGNTVVESLLDVYRDDLDYYNSLDEKRSRTFDKEKQQAIAIIQQLGQLAKQNKQIELSQQIDSVFYQQIEFLR
ncbi:MAG: DUF2723 domain-containing protein [Bacteroidales bacterium]|nr:DUF2723 domain-containing protein [Bacteroidales bacterium]